MNRRPEDQRLEDLSLSTWGQMDRTKSLEHLLGINVLYKDLADKENVD